MKTIKVNGKNVLVDDDDYDLLRRFKWKLDSKGYAQACVRMSRLIMKPEKGLTVDHINFNTIDNQKKNLRICTDTENQWHRSRGKKSNTGYKGVSYRVDNINRPYAARFTLNKKRLTFHFKTLKEAVLKYNELVKKHRGIFGVLNNIPE